MLKMEKDYEKEYGDIPKDSLERIDYLLKDTKLHRCKLRVYDEIKRISKIKWKTISYTIYLLPKATPRPRSSKNGIFYVKGAADNKKFFRAKSWEEIYNIIYNMEQEKAIKSHL